MGALLPMNIFLRQEIDRIQRVITEVHTTLIDLKLAIDGTIIMSSALKESLDAMYDARIPATWQKVRWTFHLEMLQICFADVLGVCNSGFLVH
jgi:dynein heavy chain, axonemal